MGAARTLLVAGALVGALLCVGVIAAGDLRVGLRWVRRRTAMALRPEPVRVALAQAGLDSIPTEAWVGLRAGGALLAGLVAWAWFGLPVLGLVAFVVTYHLAGVALEAKRRGFESRRQQALLEAVRHGIAVMSRAGSATQMLEALAESGPYEVVLQGSGERAGNRVYVDDKLLIDNWKIARALQPHVTLELSAGPHKVVVEDRQSSAIGGRIRLGIADQRKLVSEAAKTLAAKVDVVVIAAGFDPDSESEGSDRTFDLPVGQEELIRELSAANHKTVVAVTSGGNVDPGNWLDHVPAYIEMWYPGEQGGTALAEILFGVVNPSGHLPATFERRREDNPTFATYYPEADTKRVTYKEGVFVGYRGYEHNGVKPLFPFGYGLSYTTFKYENLSVAPVTGSADALYTVSFDLSNTGDRAGAEVAQVYVADDHSKIARPAKELKGFAKVTLQPGETKHVSVNLDARSFAYFDAAAKQWHIMPGTFGILVGGSSQDIALKGSVAVTASSAN